MKIKLLIYINGFAMGGAQNMVYELVQRIDRSEFDVHILCHGNRIDNSLTRKIEAVMPVEYLGMEGKITPAMFYKALKGIDRYQPDVVHAHLGAMVFAVPWGLLRRKPVLVTAHTKPEKAFPAKILPLLRWEVRKNRVWLAAVSDENQRLMLDFFSVDEKKCVCINNGINIDRYFQKEHDGFCFINVARQDENKNQALILRCFADIHQKNPHTKLYLLGDGPEHDSLMEMVKSMELGSSVVLTGNVPNAEDYYSISDAYVQSSHREAMPLSVLEAMASSLPIISTDVGGLRDVVKENGVLVCDGDEAAFAGAMERILGLTLDERWEMGKRSRKMVEDGYSSQKMADDYMRVYRELCL